MNTQSLPFRVFAVLLSLTLMAGFVYYRAGGSPLADPVLRFGGSPDEQVEELKLKIEQLEEKIDQLLADREELIPADATVHVVPVSATIDIQEPNPPAEEPKPTSAILYSSKSAPVFLPTDAPPDPTPVAPATPARKELLPGSKSRAVIDPELLLPAANAQSKLAVKQAANSPRPNEPTPRPTILPGSKSIILADPVSASPQPQQGQAQRPQPQPKSKQAANQKPATKTRPSANQPNASSPRLLPGSKSDGVFNPNDLPRQQAAQPQAQSRDYSTGNEPRQQR